MSFYGGPLRFIRTEPLYIAFSLGYYLHCIVRGYAGVLDHVLTCALLTLSLLLIIVLHGAASNNLTWIVIITPFRHPYYYSSVWQHVLSLW